MAGTSDDVSIHIPIVSSEDDISVGIEIILPVVAERDELCLCIDEKLRKVPSTPINQCIFRVRDSMRSQNEKLYDPEILSIGPLHHGETHLMKMEDHKLRFLKNMLHRMGEANADKYVEAIKSLENEALECYAETLKFDTKGEFVKMLLLDGCFIIELIRKSGIPGFTDNDVTIFRNEQVLSQLRHDLILIENQIPFFILDRLFSMTKSELPEDNIRDLFKFFIFNPSSPPASPPEDGLPYHLVGLVHEILVSSLPKTFVNTTQNEPSNSPPDGQDAPTPRKPDDEILNINCATELYETGVKFENYIGTFLKVDFDDGVLKMPRFYVYDGTESFLRNIIAYERCFSDDRPKYLTDYVFLMQCLINSRKDVQLLRCRGVITNFLGDDEMVYSLFNRFGTNIITSSHFCYSQIFNKVNLRYRSRGSKWKATLRNTYFNGPWKTIAFFASVLLLLLTIGQTVFVILSYKKL